MRSSWSFGVLILAMGCGSGADDTIADGTNGEPGGTTGAGGAQHDSGTVGTGGKAGAGGAVGTGGKAGTGGTTGSGGANSGGAAGSGGATASGGTTGSGGAFDAGHTVGTCGALAAAGTWELISPSPWSSSSKNEALSVVVNPQNPSIVFAVAGDKTNGGSGGTGVYKSTDCGAAWTKISTGQNAAMLETGDVWQLGIDPALPDVMYASNGYGSPPSLFRSNNGGVDWKVLMPDGGTLAQAIGGNFMQGFSIDPTDSTHLVVTFHFNCSGAYAPMCLAETKDRGDTWRPFKGPTSGWSEGGGPVVLGATTWLYASSGGMHYTKDSGATWEKVADNAGASPYRAKDGSIFLGGDQGMLRSTDGHVWNKVANAPKASGIIGDGTDLYAVYQNDYSGQPFYTAKESDPTSWTHVQTPTIKQGGGSLAYDADHHVLYAACWGAGLWRVVTP